MTSCHDLFKIGKPIGRAVKVLNIVCKNILRLFPEKRNKRVACLARVPCNLGSTYCHNNSAKNQFASTVQFDHIRWHITPILFNRENLCQGTKVQLRFTKIDSLSHSIFLEVMVGVAKEIAGPVDIFVKV